MDKISVIVPVYKVEQFLDQCIQSIVNQTYSNLEIILVDDGSPDRCPDMCDAWAKKDMRIKVIHKENGGLSDARNAGIKIATGSYTGFVDSDDWIAPTMYEKLMHKALQDHCDVVACAVDMVFDDETANRKLTHNSKETVYTPEQALEELLRERDLLQPVWYKLYKTELIADIPFEVGKLHEDTFWTYQVIGSAECIGVITDTGYYYRQRSGSIMSAQYSLRRLDAVEAKEYRQKYLQENYPALTDIGLLDLWFFCMYHGQQALRGLNSKTEINQAFNVLNSTLKEFPLHNALIAKQSATHKMWLKIARHSLRTACSLRNAAKIGL